MEINFFILRKTKSQPREKRNPIPIGSNLWGVLCRYRWRDWLQEPLEITQRRYDWLKSRHRNGFRELFTPIAVFGFSNHRGHRGRFKNRGLASRNVALSSPELIILTALMRPTSFCRIVKPIVTTTTTKLQACT